MMGLRGDDQNLGDKMPGESWVKMSRLNFWLATAFSSNLNSIILQCSPSMVGYTVWEKTWLLNSSDFSNCSSESRKRCKLMLLLIYVVCMHESFWSCSSWYDQMIYLEEEFPWWNWRLEETMMGAGLWEPAMFMGAGHIFEI